MIAVIASMQDELQFCEKCEFLQSNMHGIFEVKKYQFKDEPIVTSVCGTGKVAAALCAQTLINEYNPQIVVSIGTSGSLSSDIHPNDVIISEAAIQHDYDCSPFGYKKGEQCELGIVEMKADQRFLSCAKALYEDNKHVHFGNVLSGDRVIVDSEQKKKLLSDFTGLCCEMEAGAIAQVCAMYNVGFAAVKGISDGDESSEDAYCEFKENTVSSSMNCGDVLLEAIKKFTLR